MRIIHARERPEGLRFRLWCTIVDAYCCEEMERDAFAKWTAEDNRRHSDPIAERLDRAAARGTSAFWEGPYDLKEPWHTERCDGPRGCGGFHHAYKPGADGPCRQCGNPKSDRSHGEPCDGAERR